METPFVQDVAIILLISIVILFVCNKIKLPVIVGFFIIGMLAGPYGLGLIKAIHEVEVLAEIGIILLLFTIGIEFSLKNLFKIKRAVLVGGSLQVFLTILASFAVAKACGLSTGQSVFIGFLMSLSSTAIVLKILQERGELDSSHGLTTLGILIFQDIVVVLMMLLLPFLAGQTDGLSTSMIYSFFKGMATISLIIVAARFVIPWLLYHITLTKSNELFLLSIVGICLGIAYFTSWVGLSLAIGAFLAGLIISESEYSYQALSNVLPFRDVFTSIFFISIGMLFDINFFMHNMPFVLFASIAVLVLKTTIAASVVAMLGFSFRTNMLVGLALSQVGEFSFVLFKSGADFGIVGKEIYQAFLAVSVITMASAPLIIRLARPIVDQISNLPMPSWFKHGLYSTKMIEKDVGKSDHLIIIGYGVNGKTMSYCAKDAKIPYVIIELNPHTVKKEKKQGEPIYYGDATHEPVLKFADIHEARAIVIGISDSILTKRITEIARRLNPNINIIARARFISEMNSLYKVGVSNVVTEEIEASIEILRKIFEEFALPKEQLVKLINEIQANHHKLFEELKEKDGV